MGGDPAGGGENSVRRALLGEMLVAAKVITTEQLTEVLAARRDPGKKLGQMLIERGWVTEAQLTQTLSLQLSVPWVSLYHIDFSRQLLNRVARELAEKYCLIPIFVRHVKGQGETLYVAMDDPTNELALTEVSRAAGLPARPMIASASDIRSAIRVYYGEPSSQMPAVEVPMPPTRVDPSPMTTREGRGRVEPAPHTPPVPTQPEGVRGGFAAVGPPAAGPQGARTPSQPPPVPARPRTPSQPPPRSPREDLPPPTTRSNPPPGGVAAAAAEADALPETRAERRSRPDDAPDEPRARRRPRMVSLTLLDGTQITLPAKKNEGAEGLTARDFVAALRAHAHGADAREILGDQAPRWEPVVAALLSILLRKGLIADWEFVEELRKM